jgi:hypothetical protein
MTPMNAGTTPQLRSPKLLEASNRLAPFSFQG